MKKKESTKKVRVKKTRGRSETRIESREQARLEKLLQEPWCPLFGCLPKIETQDISVQHCLQIIEDGRQYLGVADYAASVSFREESENRFGRREFLPLPCPELHEIAEQIEWNRKNRPVVELVFPGSEKKDIDSNLKPRAVNLDVYKKRILDFVPAAKSEGEIRLLIKGKYRLTLEQIKAARNLYRELAAVSRIPLRVLDSEIFKYAEHWRRYRKHYLEKDPSQKKLSIKRHLHPQFTDEQYCCIVAIALAYIVLGSPDYALESLVFMANNLLKVAVWADVRRSQRIRSQGDFGELGKEHGRQGGLKSQKKKREEIKERNKKWRQSYRDFREKSPSNRYMPLPEVARELKDKDPKTFNTSVKIIIRVLENEPKKTK